MSHFSLAELVRSDHPDLQDEPSTAAQLNLARLVADLAEPARAILGVPLHVNSGYRGAALNAAVAMVTVYSAEVFPTRSRARGSGVVNGATKAGGFIGPLVMAVTLAAFASSVFSAVLLGTLLVGAGLLVWRASANRPVATGPQAELAAGERR